MQTHRIVGALLEIEQSASNSLKKVQRLQEQLPLRIQTESEQLQADSERETVHAIQELQAEIEAATEERLLQIAEDSSKQMVGIESRFKAHKDILRAELFRRIVSAS